MFYMERDSLSILGEGECGYESAICPPVFLSSTFESGGNYSYSRCSNPTRSALERECAALEGGSFAFAFSSGLAAINSVFSLLKSGDRVIVSDDLYGGTYRLITELFSNYGIEFVFADLCSQSEAERAISNGAAMVFAESPTNPMMKIADIAFLASLCKQKGALLAVDNTFLSPYFQNPLALGADIAVHSATKFISGHHDSVAGVAVTDSEAIASRLSLISKTLGNALSPFDSWLVLRGIRTLPLRMEKHQRNAFAAAELLKSSSEVESVIFPGLCEHSGHELCKRQARGFGGVVSFTVKSTETAKRILRGGKIIKFAESLGGFRSLITYPMTQTHYSIPKEMRERIGITDRLFRLSVGLENEKDIICDLERMLGT
ncbi:MAG: aminotransferase class I/II-fold pyridoxal phosphate-dependent enzyme [Clostridia bacterium]|nr:aminotransferase class I/II-fold pyridoxal phosphate-dependent enzyme [Clostridia bacterium]